MKNERKKKFPPLFSPPAFLYSQSRHHFQHRQRKRKKKSLGMRLALWQFEIFLSVIEARNDASLDTRARGSMSG